MTFGLAGAAFWFWSPQVGELAGRYSWWSTLRSVPALSWLPGPRAAAEGLVLQGNVEVRQVNLGFKVGGRIASLAVDEGATVREGQSLASLEKVYFEDAVAQARAQRDQARANLDKAQNGNRPEEIAQAQASVAEREATLANARLASDRAEQLLRSGAGTTKAHDDALAALRQADAQLNSARQYLALMRAGARAEDIAAARAQLANSEAALAVAQRQLADAELVAPTDGTVLSRVRETGAIVNAGETVFVLSLTNPVWVRSYVSQVDLGRVRPGQMATIRIDTPGAPTFKGWVGFISTTAEFTPKTVETRELRTALVYRIRVVAEDPRGVLRQGMPVTITLASTSTEPMVAGASE
ncbi:efflux RND transporter periplasmic adaptor subunit [Methylobacterium nodulans]|uniref:Secretion protein HlyD family protein n=1 Tax=Methylobacterium nodulans (strain LMG 21967 / CNCM I-2342 / ORS 2060) TaxID=460265 RepID=B8IX48_METNO|nr:secretion protein HlyD family protein [Methylobacterium nodulans ORS 2060]